MITIRVCNGTPPHLPARLFRLRIENFYLAALGPLGYKDIHTSDSFVGLGADGVVDFWFSTAKEELDATKARAGVHVIFTAESREVVDQFYQAALYVFVL